MAGLLWENLTTCTTNSLIIYNCVVKIRIIEWKTVLQLINFFFFFYIIAYHVSVDVPEFENGVI